MLRYGEAVPLVRVQMEIPPREQLKESQLCVYVCEHGKISRKTILRC